MKNRLGVFLFHDSDGVVDEYIDYLLSSIKNVLGHMIIVINGTADKEALDMFSKYTAEIIRMEDAVFDFSAWKHVIVETCGRERLKEFSSMVFLDDSFFGPFRPFEDIFQKMENTDFWGLSAYGETNSSGKSPYGYRPRYIQPYFMVFESQVLHSDAFFDFWVWLPEYQSDNEYIERGVCVLTKKLEDLGYRWGVYSDTSDMESADRNKNYDQTLFNIYELVSNRKYPVLRKQLFEIDKRVSLSFTNGAELMRTVEYIENNFKYDVTMIFKHVMRKYSPYDVKSSLCLDYVLPDFSNEGDVKQNEAVIIVHMVYSELFEKYKRYLMNVPKGVDIIITTNSDENVSALESVYLPFFGDRVKIRKSENRGRDVAALLVTCKDILLKYEYLCFIHDKKSSAKEFAAVGTEFDRVNWENLLGSEGYIKNIIGLFRKHKYLGMLSPFGVDHGTYFHTSMNYWTICADEVKKLAEDIGIPEPDTDKELFAVGTCFWCRTKAMEKIFSHGFTHGDFCPEPMPVDGSVSHAIERIFPFVAAAEGYCSGWIYNTEYARTELSAYRYMADNSVRETVKRQVMDFYTYRDYIRSVCKGKKVEIEEEAEFFSAERNRSLRKKIKKLTPKPIIKAYRRRKYNSC